MIGQTLGHYEILEKLGAGGMGVVYLAVDHNLDRKVALKVLPADLAANQERLERFEREAKILAAVDHPNIVHIYSIEEENGLRFLTMQLVEGEPLSRLVPPEGMPLSQLFDIAIPLADAVAVAHERGVTHRDLKPGNIMITDRGEVRVLDFGLAKLQLDPGGAVNTELPTEPITDEGRILGTVPYMSPEQLEGKVIDSRSDTFSLGVVLHEMATGERPFKGDSSASLISSIMKDTPREVDTVREDLPHHLARIIRRCLEKDSQRRFQSVLDVRNELQDLREEVEYASRSHASKESVDTRPTSPRSMSLKAGLVIVAVLLGVAAATMLLLKTWGQGEQETLGASDQLLLTDFVNRTDDPVFDGTLNQALAVKLEESPFLSIVPATQVQETLLLMGLGANETVTPEVGREVCRRMGVKAMVTGEISAIGTNYIVSLAASECENATVLARELIEVVGKESVLSALGTATTKVREDLGESLASISRYDSPVEQATTSSLEALKILTLAEEARNAGKDAETISLFERALEIDPDFALAHARLGTVFANLQQWEKSDLHKLRAYELRDRVSEKERMYISAHYFNSVTGEVNKAVEAYKDFKRIYPRDWVPPNNLCDEYNRAGLYLKAVEECEEAVRLNPDSPLPHSNLADAYLRIGRTEEAKQVLEQAFRRGFDAPYLLTTRFEIAFLEDDRATMLETVEALDGEPRESDVLILKAESEAAVGRLDEAYRITNRAIRSSETHGLQERKADFLSRLAVWNAAFGLFEDAIGFAEAALDSTSNRDSLPSAAIVFAVAGETERARQLTEDLSELYPRNTYIQSVWIPLTLAALALEANDPQASLEALDEALPYQRSHLEVIATRGRAFLGLSQPAQALSEFDKLIDLRTVLPTRPVHTLAWLLRARAQVSLGETGAAESSYATFLALVETADEGLPAVDAAREEYTALQQRAGSD